MSKRLLVSKSVLSLYQQNDKTMTHIPQKSEKIVGYAAIIRYNTHTFNYDNVVSCVNPLYTGTTEQTTYIRTQSQCGSVFCNKADIYPTITSAKIAAKNSKSNKMRNFEIEITPVYISEIGLNSTRLFFKNK